MPEALEQFEVGTVVVGAGVVGLAVAAELAQQDTDVWLLEKESLPGSVTSSRNSEVIHAGIYYPDNSLKARLCVEGREQLYAFCEQYRVPHRRCGKLIVATREEDESKLSEIAAQAARNGVDNLRWLSGRELWELEPDIQAVCGLHSPSTGILDSHQYMQQLLALFEQRGGSFVCRTAVEHIECEHNGWLLTLGGETPCLLRCREVVNCAGLDARRILEGLEDYPSQSFPPLRYAKGQYFSYSGAHRFQHLIYPVPVPGGLGIHLTLDMGGQARFGPDVQWVEEPEYTVDPTSVDDFEAAIREYWPYVRRDALQPAYAGVRPKLSGPGDPAADFLVETPTDHGLPGLFNLLGIESPGLTASLALATYAVDEIRSFR